jgi:tetratricopeptide (TPR) repeat protein
MSPMETAKAKGWWEVPLQAGAILLAGLWVFSAALRGGWLWDDSLEISQNPWLRSWSGLGKIWFSRGGLDYFPFKSSVQWLLWQAGGEQPYGYHLTSLLLHILSAFLFWRLLGKLGVRLAWLGGLFFVVHPLVVESVAWISELKNTLSLALLLAAANAYLRWREVGTGSPPVQAAAKAFPWRWSALTPTRLPQDGAEPAHWGQCAPPYFLSLFLFLLAMLSKSTVVMFPCVILLYAWWRHGRIGRRDLFASLPFFVVSFALGLTTLWFQHHRAMPGGGSVHLGGFFSRAASAGLAVEFYLSKCLFPVRLLPIYPPATVALRSMLAGLPWVGLAVVLGALWTCRQSWGRPVLFGLGWFLLNLLPVLGFVPMAYQRVSWVADHFAYLPLLGLVGLAVAGLDRWYSSSRGQAGMVWPVACAAVIGLGFAMQSRAYAAVFRDEETLWTYTLRHNPGAWIAQSGLGKIRLEQGRLPEAAADFQRALQLEPDSAEVEANLGSAFFRMGNASEAMAHYDQAIRINPGFAGAYYNLGVALLQTSQPEAAAKDFTIALRFNPDYAAAQNNLGLALARLGRLTEAFQHYDEALRLQPNFPEVQLNLGNAYFTSGRLPEAIAHYEAALRLDPRYAAAHHNLGFAYQHVGRMEEAKAQFAEAARLGAKP